MADTNTMQNWHGDNTPMQGVPIDISSLMSLLQPNANPQDAQNGLGPATLKQVGNVGVTAQQATGRYQQGVAKALKDYGIKHATEALASGANPVDIQNHPLMQDNSQEQGQIDPNAMAVLSALISKNAPASTGAVSSPTATPDSTGAYNPTNPIDKVFTALGITPSPDSQALLSEATLNRQKASAGNPSEVAVPQAQAAAINQKLQGKEPLQPADYASIVGGMNTLKLDALKTASQKMDDDLKERQAEIDTSQKTINMMGRLGGMFNGSGQTVTQASAAAQKEIQKIKLAKAAVDAKIATFKPNNPVTNKIQMEAPSSATHYSPSTGKYYDAQGQEIK